MDIASSTHGEILNWKSSGGEMTWVN